MLHLLTWMLRKFKILDTKSSGFSRHFLTRFRVLECYISYYMMIRISFHGFVFVEWRVDGKNRAPLCKLLQNSMSIRADDEENNRVPSNSCCENIKQKRPFWICLQDGQTNAAHSQKRKSNLMMHRAMILFWQRRKSIKIHKNSQRDDGDLCLALWPSYS